MKKAILVLSAIALLVDNTCRGWWSGGHGILTRAAIKAAPMRYRSFSDLAVA